ncbi:hypothetical protein [Chryseosolibacter indicus]|uniref:Uncharacterized protein n=1 Tax=Chryseosolibacter indicus TaxID=2782351 RepID=A0ABS5VZD2_9BACT|nr:hypothetical protein [Chryseosolibacter indicus]MBT1706433.1 hypothetical protein [Chryseosolibacter indicus]
MAISTSQLHRNLRGALGDLIFRNYNGKTVVSMRPKYKNETNTEARRQARGKFREATFFASHAMMDKKLKAYYMQKARQLKLPNAYTAAITDYLRKAKAGAVKPSSFAAKKGDTVMLLLSKGVFKIRKIKAILFNHDGEVLSEQHLTKAEGKNGFEFTFTDDFPDYAGFRIITDEPGKNEYTIYASDFLILPV